MNSIATIDEQKARIIDVAQGRFLTYGYGKTTMAEIAQDCQCSAGNLYRFFYSKQDIAEAVCRRCMSEGMKQLREMVRESNTTARDRLRIYVVTNLKYTRETFEKSPKMTELIHYMLEQRQALVHEEIRSQCSLIAEVLAYGNETGEFCVENIITTSLTVYISLTAYHVPLFQSLYTGTEFEQLAHNTVDLLLKGLEKRQ